MRLVTLLLVLGLVSGCGARRGAPDPSKQAEGDDTTSHARRAQCTLADSGCHSPADCGTSAICAAAPPSSDYGCGIPPHQVESCKADADCGADQVCNAFAFGCDVGHRCEARCNTAGCQPGWACHPDGRCGVLRCPDEWSCADYGACRPPAPNEGLLQGGRDWHGCVPLACKRDLDCPCAHCVNSRCAPIPGRCIEARG